MARRRARLTQRELAQLCRFHQPALARIERGKVIPRVDTLDRILRACGERLDSIALPPEDDVDASQLTERLDWSVQDRLDELIAGAEAFESLMELGR